MAAQAQSAKDVLKATGIRGGLVVHVGCSDGKLTAALRAGDSYLVHGLNTDAEQVAEAREYVRSLGIYGKVSADTFDGRRLPYVDNLVSLMVVEDLGEVSADEVMRVLAPRGVAYVKRNGKWQKTVMQRPEDIDEWTHYLYNASGNAVSGDRLVGPTRYLKWVAGPLWSRSHEYTPSLAAMVSAGGKIFSIHDDGVRGVTDKRVGDRWMVHARDAFKWPASLEAADVRGLGRRCMGLAAETGARPCRSRGDWWLPQAESTWTLGYRSHVTVLDTETGELIRELDNTQNAEEMVLIGKTLLVRRRKVIPGYSKQASAWKVQRRKGQEPFSASPGDEAIVAVNVETREGLGRRALRRAGGPPCPGWCPGARPGGSGGSAGEQPDPAGRGSCCHRCDRPGGTRMDGGAGAALRSVHRQ